MFDGSGGRGDIPSLGLAPGMVVAGFTIEGLLASGSFGTVYRARRDGRLFAIKLVPLAPRGDREVDALRRMRHPNVVGFHGYGLWPEEQPHSLVLALELVEGLPLDQWAQEENPTALDLVGRVLLPLALTLADVHAMGVVHRDVKEANIIVRQSDGMPVLVDFGAASLEGAQRLTQWMPPGTPEYRSPETLRFGRQWEGEPYPVSPAEDLWAMGVVTYILLTRSLPFGDRHDPGMVRAILEKTPRAPDELNPRVPPALSELCMQMLEKAPEDRYADARALAEALSTAWSEADRSWRVRLFPEVKREEAPAPPPPPAPEAPIERQAPGRWRMARLVLGAALLGGVLIPSSQRSESPPPPQTQHASARQELAPPQVMGEVGHVAGPQKSLPPAPVASATPTQEPKMIKPKKARSLAAATLLTGAACMGAGCASTPKHEPLPTSPCPPGAKEALTQIGLIPGDARRIYIPPNEPRGHTIEISEGEVTARVVGAWGNLPNDAFLYGEFIFRKNHVYGHFTRAQLKNGEIVPVCMEVTTSRGIGIAKEPGSTSKKAIVKNFLYASVTSRFD
ncbi:MAG TPA: protein kinase [Archangium sp.]|uniref:serine/threonine protein kinase n=1 Tax=Archangium sp. TaxID=1872627 RepID=UPI002E30E2CF|nr:protein kinase [Archangium sp.]HEX5745434.1 protein kinase [Archangium sp.]